VEGYEQSASCPIHFTPGEIAAGTHWIGGWVGTRASFDVVVKRKKNPFTTPLRIKAQSSSP